MKKKRVVITGMGVVAPNATGLLNYKEALIRGRSGIKFQSKMQEWGLRCRVAGIPNINEDILKEYFPEPVLRGLHSTGVKYACLASIEAFLDAGLQINGEDIDYDFGCIFGCSIGDVSYIKRAVDMLDNKTPKKLGTRFVEQSMASGASAYIAGLFGLGNRVFSNSSACSTGTESVLLAYEAIKNGNSKRMIAGSCESASPYIWGGFDSMRVLSRKFNDFPEKASRPLSASAGGFVPGAGSACLILEELESAQKRNAKIYAEILGGSSNCGGQRHGGTMTAPNNLAVRKCISDALMISETRSDEIDLVSGHLTATMADSIEVDNWVKALGRKGENFPYLNSTKSMIGHCLSAAGSLECVASILQIHEGFIHPSINCDDFHPVIAGLIHRDKVPNSKIKAKVEKVIKANFGFGDVNSCIVFSKYKY